MSNHQKRSVNLSNVSPLRGDLELYELESINASDIEAKQQPWLWPNVIPFDTSTLFVGEGGIGKSLLLLELASKVSTGEEFKACGESVQFQQGKVIIMSAEDDFEYQLKPKLMAAEADTSQIEIIKLMRDANSKKRKFVDLLEHLSLLEDKIVQMGNVKMVIIDPVSYFIGKLKDHINVEVANFIDSINRLAKPHHFSCILNKHLRKQSSGANVLHAMSEVSGCGAWVNTPRAAWVISRHPEMKDRVCMVDLKANLKEKSFDSRNYQIIGADVKGPEGVIKSAKVDWFPDMLNISADQAMSKDVYEKSKLQQASDLVLEHIMENGDSVQKAIEDNLTKKGIARRTFFRAIEFLKKEDSIRSRKGAGFVNVLYLTK